MELVCKTMKQYLITTYDQFSIIRPSPYYANILESSISSEPYTAWWYKRCINCGDPWIGTDDHCAVNNNCWETLYAEDSTTLHSGRFKYEDDNIKSLNVWIKNSYDGKLRIDENMHIFSIFVLLKIHHRI